MKMGRGFREMWQQKLVKKAGIGVPYLSQLETNKRTGSVEVLAASAKILNVSLENIVSVPA